MKNIFKIASLALVVLLSACELDPVLNPNDPTSESFENGASLADLKLLAAGVESNMRSDMGFHFNTVSIVGREYYDLTNTDPRYTGELVGKNGEDLDNNGFLTTRAFSQVYRVARNANNLIVATQNSAAGLSDAEKGGIIGVAETLKAYSLLLELGRQGEGGMRIDVVDPDNLGPFLSYSESLTALKQSLDAAYGQLTTAGTLPIDLSFISQGGVTFPEFNRAIAARVAMYQGDKPAMLSALNNSFIDEAGSLTAGLYHPFGLTGNDISNPLVVVPGQSFFMAHPNFDDDADMNDSRVTSKTTDLGMMVTSDMLSGDRQISLYTGQTDPVPLIRNEELILMLAEANIGTNNGEAQRLLNLIRVAAGTGTVSFNTDAEAVDELLKQRRYSLFGEGHRWLDLRRYNKLGELPLDRAGDIIHQRFPRPVLEG